MLNFTANGQLVPGIHDMDMISFKEEFGSNTHRLQLIGGMERAILAFRSFNVASLYVDGSFVTRKGFPSDYDICYEMEDNELARLFLFYPIFKDFSNGRKAQKEVFHGEFFLATSIAAPPKEMYMDFFQHDKNDKPKGIVKLHI